MGINIALTGLVIALSLLVLPHILKKYKMNNLGGVVFGIAYFAVPVGLIISIWS